MSRPAHILALVTDAWGGRGGIAQYNRDLLSALAECDGIASITVLPRQAPDLIAPPSGIRQAPARARRFAYSLAALAEAYTNRVDVVFCGHLYMAPLGQLVARLKGAKLVVQAHGIEAWPRPTKAQRRAVEAANLVLSVSRHTRQTILGWASIPPERLIVVPNTVGGDFSPGNGHVLREAWGLQGKRVLLTVGRMDARERYKGHDRIIDALASLPDDVVFVVIGEGDDRPRLERAARAASVDDRVRFMGALPASAKLDAYRMADLFVMPSTGEGFGIVFLEAMACGTPALGLGVAGARDALADGDLGYMTQADDLVEAIHSALYRKTVSGKALASAVAARFGRAAFTDRVAAVASLVGVAS